MSPAMEEGRRANGFPSYHNTAIFLEPTGGRRSNRVSPHCLGERFFFPRLLLGEPPWGINETFIDKVLVHWGWMQRDWRRCPFCQGACSFLWMSRLMHLEQQKVKKGLDQVLCLGSTDSSSRVSKVCSGTCTGTAWDMGLRRGSSVAPQISG